MVAIGCDHGGFALKEEVLAHLAERSDEVKDFGCFDKKSVDYPGYARAVAEAVASGTAQKGIVICTTGIGVSIVANKVKGIRCALCAETSTAKLTRLHNDANVLALGGGMIGPKLAADIVDVFLDTPFSREEKHSRRISRIEE
ncbi:ribose 5-phosphate isomerase B [Lachnoclostridium sp. Marseille-P6806]|uniref:ribose 5-phosphate isomerase B n=1 Tax=Lachnoclostridium sp. Marseille-P6806 TaxID=2364793 RepID=UPI001031344F|nr:ribose 5-phosphate isomerase B [Lachnoclostridium sp. Marseille-P6806]